jgi:hypothetical protein
VDFFLKKAKALPYPLIKKGAQLISGKPGENHTITPMTRGHAHSRHNPKTTRINLKTGRKTK